MNGIQFGAEIPIHTADGNYTKRWGIAVTDAGDIEVRRYNASEVYQETPVTIALSTGIATFSSGNLALAANSVTNAAMADDAVDSAEIADGAVDPVHLSSTAISPAADGACAILNTTTEINLTVSAAGTVVISTTSSVPGQVIYIRAASVAGGGSYTLAVTGGTLTFNSTGEAAIVRRNTANSAWLVYSLCPSSSTAANIATIV